MKPREKEASTPQLQNDGILSFFDVDARSELRSVPLSSIWFPPRIGEQIELRADIEHGGGIYVVVGVRHVLEDSDSTLKPSAAVVGVVIDVKPQHAAEPGISRAAVDLNLEEIVSIPVVPLPLTLELTTPEPEEK